jgi:hypothetical protein
MQRFVGPLRKRKIAPEPPGTGPLVHFRCGNYLPYLDACSEGVLRDAEKESKMATPYKRERYITDPPKFNKKVDGEERFRLFEDYLENRFRWRRHVFQRQFHEKAMMVIAPLILGEDADAVMPALVKQRQWPMQRNSRMLLGSAPRRFGKSVAESMLAATSGLVIPKCTIAIFSTGKRISMYMGEKIRDDITDAGEADRILSFGQERLNIQGDHPEDIRSIFYYPANAQICIFIISLILFSLYYDTRTPPLLHPPLPPTTPYYNLFFVLD